MDNENKILTPEEWLGNLMALLASEHNPSLNDMTHNSIYKIMNDYAEYYHQEKIKEMYGMNEFKKAVTNLIDAASKIKFPKFGE